MSYEAPAVTNVSSVNEPLILAAVGSQVPNPQWTDDDSQS